MSNKDIEIYSEALKRKAEENKSTQDLTYSRDKSREKPRDFPRGNARAYTRDKPRGLSRAYLRELPTRDEIQEFNFLLRDEFKVKVQAELPHHWKDEIEEISRRQKIQKLELYRFIFGEFLGKIQRKKGDQ